MSSDFATARALGLRWPRAAHTAASCPDSLVRRRGIPRLLVALAATVLAASCATTSVLAPSVEIEAPVRLEPVGAFNADVTQATIHQTICVPGWTAKVRPSSSYTSGIKSKLMREQGVPQSEAAKYELDHFIPLAVGGHPRDIRNLWLQPWEGEWGAKAKDRLEVKMKALVCTGRISLESAQEAIQANWRAAYRRYVVGADTRSSNSADDTEDSKVCVGGGNHSWG